MQDTQKEYERDLDQLKATCEASDLDIIEKTLDTLDRKWVQSNELLYVQLLRAACDEIAARGLRTTERGRRLVERLASQALGKADESQIDVQLHLLLSYLRLDDKLSQLGAGQRAQARKASAELWVSVWRRLESLTDPNWDPNDPRNAVVPYIPPPGVIFPPSGAPAEAVPDPKIRAEYEAHLKKNERIARGNYQQRMLRRLKQDYSGSVEEYLITIYSIPPPDREELKSCLVVIKDNAMRQKILSTVKENHKP